ncbi:hypothetical protein FCM35_KLT02820 [Carex littledalei]|uniref:PGG domain-containing protein n=1 Tax=Carex littledalei TaxID=544730 RepID=A0A833R957_9POAL|nr:hypothetical protein FCM35_KLT02820 [Carex littledalei]
MADKKTPASDHNSNMVDKKAEAASTNNPSKADTRKNWFDERRDSIMVVAVLAASVTYTTGLNPPGGLWQDELNNHKAGSSILHDKFPDRYTTFFYANATAFMASLVIIILIMNENVSNHRSRFIVMYITMVLDLVSLMIAYAAGCARRLSTSIYVIGLAVAVLAFVATDHFLITYFNKFFPNCCSPLAIFKKICPNCCSSSSPAPQDA